jgi:glycosyltransferase involved in cell wall biosynthesis
MAEKVRSVLFLAYYFPPFGGGGVQRSLKFAKCLPDFGWVPTVVTRPLERPVAWTPPDDALVVELPAAVEVVRVAGPEPERRGGWWSRAERWLRVEEPFARWWVDAVVARGREAGRGADVVYASMSPFETGEAAARLAGELGRPWIADLRDPWALDEWLVFPSALHRRLELRRMRRTLASASAVVMNTPEAAAELVRQVPEVRENAVVTIPNGFDAADFEASPPERGDGPFRIVHAGQIYPRHDPLYARLARRALGGAVRGLDVTTRSHVTLVRAVAELHSRRPELRGAIEIHLVGSVSDEVRATLPPWVVVHGYVPHAEAVAQERAADLVFLPMHDLPGGTRSRIVPGKTYEYLVAGPPILAAVPDGDARDLLAAAGNAFLCRPNDVGAMARLIGERLDARVRGERAPAVRPEVAERYERRRLTGELANLFDRVLGAPARESAALVAGAR